MWGGLRFCVGFCLVLERYLLFLRCLGVNMKEGVHVKNG
jgi:hypothetical protein